MNEEIKVKFGADLGALDTALRGLDNRVKETAHGIKEGFGEAIGDIGKAFGAGALVAGFERIMGKVSEIKSASAQTGIDAEQIQRIDFAAEKMHIGAEKANDALGHLSVKIGEARTGGKEALAIFEKWGINIIGKDTNEVLNEVSDKMKATADESARAAMSVDLMGKSGKDLVVLLQGGSEALEKMSKGARIISEEQMKRVEEAHEFIKSAENDLTVFGATVISWWGSLWSAIGTFSTGGLEAFRKNHAEAADEKIEAGRRKAAAQVEAEYAAEKNKQKAAEKESAKELAIINKQISDEEKKTREDGLELYQKIRKEQEHIKYLKEELARPEDDEVRRALIKLDLLKTQSELTKHMVEDKKEDERFQKSASEAYYRRLEKEKTLTEEIEKTRRGIAFLNLKRQTDGLESVMPTIHELATGGRGWLGRDARRIEWLEQDAKTALLKGNVDWARGDMDQVKNLREGLVEAGVQSPEMKLESIDRTLTNSHATLTSLLTTAKKEGIVIKDEQ